MELFNAARHLNRDDTVHGGPKSSPEIVSPSDSDSAQARPQPMPTPAPDNSTQWIHDDLDLDSLDLDEELAKLERQEQEMSREFLELQPLSGEKLRPQPKDQSRSDDEAWAEQLLTAEANTQAPDHHGLQAESTSTPEPTLGAEDLRFTPVSEDRPAPASPLAPSRGPLIEHLDMNRRVEPVFNNLIEADEESPHPKLAEGARADIEYEQEHSTRRDREDPLFELEDEPLQLNWEARRRPWGRWVGWGFLNLIALLALAGQYVAYNFDEVSRQDDYRPWLEKVCPVLGCELPPRVDISQIKSSNLVVRSHPDFAGALVIDAIIYNRASFAQPFPLLEIRFDDISGQTQARRTFKPGEYLSGELAGQREMPSQIPIHIALDILDPGSKAVNYSLSFSSPE